MLSDKGIKAAMKAGELEISPFDENDIQPASIDVRLGPKFIDDDGNTHHADIDWVIEPGSFWLGETIERVKISPALAVRLEGRSSIGRLGIPIHVTAGFCDPGFEGRITLEITNHSKHPRRLRIGRRIGQLSVFRLSSPAERPYGHPDLKSHYQHQDGATVSYLAGGA